MMVTKIARWKFSDIKYFGLPLHVFSAWANVCATCTAGVTGTPPFPPKVCVSKPLNCRL